MLAACDVSFQLVPLLVGHAHADASPCRRSIPYMIAEARQKLAAAAWAQNSERWNPYSRFWRARSCIRI